MVRVPWDLRKVIPDALAMESKSTVPSIRGTFALAQSCERKSKVYSRLQGLYSISEILRKVDGVPIVSSSAS